MPDAVSIERFRRRLEELECPASQLRRSVREIADHREDLKNAALEEALSEAAAEARADARLGEPLMLAEQLAAAIRQASWWGRHPFIGFCLLPPVVFLLVWGLGLMLCAGAWRLCLTAEEWSVLAGGGGAGIRIIRTLATGTYYGAIAASAILFCWLARRSMSGLKWALIACAVCSLHSYLCFFDVTPHCLAVGYHLASRVQDLGGSAIPMLIGAAILAWSWRTKRRVCGGGAPGQGGGRTV
jgi:hypothetical protein